MDYLGVGWPHILISFEERAVSYIAGSSWAPLIYATIQQKNGDPMFKYERRPRITPGYTSQGDSVHK